MCCTDIHDATRWRLVAAPHLLCLAREASAGVPLQLISLGLTTENLRYVRPRKTDHKPTSGDASRRR